MTETKFIAPLRRSVLNDICDELEIDRAHLVTITLHPNHVEARVLSVARERGARDRHEVVTLVAPIDEDGA